MTNDHSSRSYTSVKETPVTERGTFFVPPWVRLAAQLFAPSLDLKLAGGAHPASSPLLAARAQQLATTRYRRSLADSWLDLLVEVRRARSLFDPSVPVLRGRVIAADDQIHSLADTLVSPLPTVRGLAMAVAILRDGSGPLFNLTSAKTLTASIEEVVAQLNPLTTLAAY
jgi:hypothetical protein